MRHIKKLSDVLNYIVAEEKRLPSSYEIKIAEISEMTPRVDGHWPRTDHRRSQVRLQAPSKYESRWDELLRAGYSWINIGTYGMHHGRILVVGVEVPTSTYVWGQKRPLFPGHPTEVMIFGAPIGNTNFDAGWQLEIVD